VLATLQASQQCYIVRCFVLLHCDGLGISLEARQEVRTHDVLRVLWLTQDHHYVLLLNSLFLLFIKNLRPLTSNIPGCSLFQGQQLLTTVLRYIVVP